MTIDSHIHFWNYDPVKDAWITDTMQVIQQDFLPDDALKVFTQNGVNGCIAVQADQSAAETRFLLDLADKHSFIMGVVGWIDLTDAAIEDILVTYSKEKNLKGFRHVVQGEPDGYLTRPDVLHGIRAAGTAGYTYDILIYNHQLLDAIQLCNTLPGQRFILDHCGKPALQTNNIAQWKTNIKELAKNPDVYCKASGLLTEDHWHSCNEGQIKECLDTIFENFGTGRVLFGSDWPVILLAGHYKQWKNIIENYTAQFTVSQRQDIFGGNATRFYNL